MLIKTTREFQLGSVKVKAGAVFAPSKRDLELLKGQDGWHFVTDEKVKSNNKKEVENA